MLGQQLWKDLNGKMSDNAQEQLIFGSWNQMNSGENKMGFFKFQE